jgi:site-specific DNA-methyltransferase (adenine-specific)
MLNLPQSPKWDIARVSHSTLVNADCFDVFPLIADKSVDAIIADLPYGTTACKWDAIIPFEPLWAEYKRVIKSDGVIALFGAEPFSSLLRTSNINGYKYEWVWVKSRPIGFLNVKKMPLKNTELISIFYNNQPTYNPQGVVKINKKRINDNSKNGNNKTGLSGHNGGKMKGEYIQEYTNYPTQVLNFASERGLHPTQKPVALLEYLIKTYTNENEIVLDNTMGSGTTGLACLKTNRQFIGIEKEKQYYDVAVRRLSEYCG